jgi:cytochrome c oxidase assembly factor CtaG
VLTFPQHPLYPAQAANAAASGINPLLDQRVGGLVMWIPLDFVYLLIAIGLFARWLHQLGARWPEPEYLGREYAGRLWEQTDLEEMR